jgi:hypothetical protein
MVQVHSYHTSSMWHRRIDPKFFDILAKQFISLQWFCSNTDVAREKVVQESPQACPERV